MKARHAGALAFALASLLALDALAAPTTGERFPAFDAADITGASHASHEIARPQRSIVVAITDRDASDAMRAWWNTVDRRVPQSVGRYSLLALHVSAIVPSGVARSRARAEVPQPYWRDTWLDIHGRMANSLGLAPSTTPYVFVLDANGTVVASAHARADQPAAHAIFDAVRAR